MAKMYSLIPKNSNPQNTMYLYAYEVKNTIGDNFMKSLDKITDSKNLKKIFTSDMSTTKTELSNIGTSISSTLNTAVGDGVSAFYDASGTRDLINKTKKIKDKTVSEYYESISNFSFTDKGDIKEVFVLPFPNALTDSYEHIYAETKLNLFDKMLKKISSGTSGDNSSLELAKQAMARSGTVLDPRILDVYQSTNLRDLNFKFTLLPQSKNEAEIFVNSLKQLKKSARLNKEDKYGGLVQLLNLNRIFTTTFGKNKGGVNNKNHIMDSIINTNNGFLLQNIRYEITTEGIGLYKDSMPKKIDVVIHLKERSPVYSDFWENMI